MGNSCTLPKRTGIAIPSRIIQVHGKDLWMQKSQSATNPHHASLKIAGRFDSSPLPESLNSIKDKPSNSEAQTAIDLDEDMKSSSEKQTYTIKYDHSELGIGEFYLQKEQSHLKFKKNSSKKNLPHKDEVSWDRVLVQMRNRTSFASIYAKEDDLGTQVSLCLKDFAITKPKVFEKMMKAGVPMKYRWPVWKNLLDFDRFFEKNLYEKLKSLSSPHEHQIKKDMNRTFPHEPFFASKKCDYIGQTQLFNTLKAVSLYFPNTGYVQGMNFIMGFLLMLSGGNEREAFWAFVTLFRDHRYLMMGFFERDFPLLEFYLYVFYSILEEEMPLVYKHLKEQQLPDQLWIFKWYMTLFIHSAPQIQVVRIWDYILSTGMLGLVQISIALIKMFEKDIMELDAFGMDQFIRHLKGDLIPNNKAKKSIQIINRSNISNINESQLHNQSIMNNQVSQTSQKPNTSLNNINGQNLDLDNNGISICNETSEFQYSFKDVDINQLISDAQNVNLPVQRVASLAFGYSEATNKKLPGIYYDYLTKIDTFYDYDGLEKQRKFQKEVDYYFMKSQLFEEPSNEIVLPTPPVQVDDDLILQDIDL